MSAEVLGVLLARASTRTARPDALMLEMPLPSMLLA